VQTKYFPSFNKRWFDATKLRAFHPKAPFAEGKTCRVFRIDGILPHLMGAFFMTS
jgi:hypothetical protein